MAEEEVDDAEVDEEGPDDECEIVAREEEVRLSDGHMRPMGTISGVPVAEGI